MTNPRKSAGLVSQEDQEGTGVNVQLPGIKRHQGVNYKVEDQAELLNYGQGSVNGEDASILPIVDKFGDVPGATNPYGLVVTGGSFRGPAMNKQTMDTSDLARVMNENTPEELDGGSVEQELAGLQKTSDLPDTEVREAPKATAPTSVVKTSPTMIALMAEASMPPAPEIKAPIAQYSQHP